MCFVDQEERITTLITGKITQGKDGLPILRIPTARSHGLHNLIECKLKDAPDIPSSWQVPVVL